jgi:hypothetical protein
MSWDELDDIPEDPGGGWADMKDETEINALALLGADPDVREIAALEKLRRAAKVAPLARSLSEKQRARKLRTESGAVVTHGEILDAQLRRDQIEIDVVSPPDRNEAVNVLCGWGLSLEEIDGLTAREITALAARKMGDSAPSLATVGRLVRRIRGRSRLPRGSSPPQPPHHESRERLRLALATPCSGCGKSPSKRVAGRAASARRGCGSRGALGVWGASADRQTSGLPGGTARLGAGLLFGDVGGVGDQLAHHRVDGDALGLEGFELGVDRALIEPLE